MNDFKVGDKVYLECEVRIKDMSDNTYELGYKNWLDDESLSTDYVKDDVLHSTDKGYNKGLNDAWELAKKITLPIDNGGYSCEELENIFGYRSPASIFKAFTPQEALAKVKSYEERNKFRVGDVIRLKGNTHEAIVTRANEINIYYLFRDGSCGWFHVEKDFEKIGHFDSIDEFMRSADD